MHRLVAWMTLFAGVVSTIGCASVITGEIHEALEQPIVNPMASDVLRITVVSNIDANVRLQAGYYTTNRDCDVQKWPGNPKIGHTKYEVFDVPTRTDGAMIEVLVDKYQPGRCLWSFGIVSVGAIVPGSSSQAWSGLLAFSERGLVPNKPLRIICQEFGPARTLKCHSSINYLRSDVRAVTFKTSANYEQLEK